MNLDKNINFIKLKIYLNKEEYKPLLDLYRKL